MIIELIFLPNEPMKSLKAFQLLTTLLVVVFVTNTLESQTAYISYTPKFPKAEIWTGNGNLEQTFIPVNFLNSKLSEQIMS